MRRLGVVGGFLTILVLAAPAHSQAVCTGILEYTGRDELKVSRENSIAADLYSQHCEGSSHRSSSATSIGLEAVVKAIPIKFNFGGSSDEETVNNFCKTYTTRRAEFSAEDIDQSTVVREALAAFNRCVELSSKDIYFNPTIGRTNIVIDVRRGSADAAITGVSYDQDLLTCNLPPSASTPSKQADGNSFWLLTGDFLPITCDRKPIIRSSGLKEYPEAAITIATSRGSLLLPIPEDGQFPEQWASEVEATVSQLKATIAALEKPKQIECKIVTDTSSRGRFPLQAASLSDEDFAAGYRATGGGCEQVEPNHNFALIKGRPTGDRSWLCQNGDLPGIAADVQITAFVVGCRIR